MSKRNLHAEHAGYICRSRSPSGWVVAYFAKEQGIDVSKGDLCAVVCEAHGAIASVSTEALARVSVRSPTDFCEDCRTAESATVDL